MRPVGLEMKPLPPSIEPLVSVARALGDLREGIVFIGGAVAPLLQTESPFDRVRPTRDVDAVAATSTYRDVAALHERLTILGFTQSVAEGEHAHEWRAPDGTKFDLVPAGDHLAGGGNPWDQVAIDTAVRVELLPELTVRHVSAPGFLALKWAAYRDRGEDDPFTSHDLEDILALIVSRPTLVDEVAAAPLVLARFIREATAQFVSHPDADDLLDANLRPAREATTVLRAARARPSALAQREM